LELLKLRPDLVGNAVAEMIRFQTPVISMRRTATRDVELHGRQIKRGEKVVLWYISGNRDETMFPDGDVLRVDRENARQHIAFGMGPHRCLGSRIAELQLRVLWEEIIARDLEIEVLGPPSYAFSAFVRTVTRLPARIRN
jgi:cytochrome P450